MTAAAGPPPSLRARDSASREAFRTLPSRCSMKTRNFTSDHLGFFAQQPHQLLARGDRIVARYELHRLARRRELQLQPSGPGVGGIRLRDSEVRQLLLGDGLL